MVEIRTVGHFDVFVTAALGLWSGGDGATIEYFMIGRRIHD